MTMDASQSWISALKDGDEAAAQRLFEDYFRRLVGLAQKKTEALAPRVADPSGIVQSALNSFFQGARTNRFPRLNDSADLWRLLVVITARKASDAVKRETRKKRGGGKVRGESVFHGMYSDFDGLEQVLAQQPTPELVAEFSEQLEHRLEMLQDEVLRAVAVGRLNGYSNREIAEQLECAERTVARKLDVIRTIWMAEE